MKNKRFSSIWVFVSTALLCVAIAVLAIGSTHCWRRPDIHR